MNLFDEKWSLHKKYSERWEYARFDFLNWIVGLDAVFLGFVLAGIHDLKSESLLCRLLLGAGLFFVILSLLFGVYYKLIDIKFTDVEARKAGLEAFIEIDKSEAKGGQLPAGSDLTADERRKAIDLSHELYRKRYDSWGRVLWGFVLGVILVFAATTAILFSSTGSPDNGGVSVTAPPKLQP